MPSPRDSSGGRFRLRDLLPFGPSRHPRPRPFLGMAEVVWENRDNLPFALRILQHGVCDGCSLGPRGLRDDVIDGVHLCMTRLKLLRLNTMGAIPEDRLHQLRPLREMRNEALHALGRLPYPMIHREGDSRLHRLSWDEALSIVAESLAEVPGERMGFFATSRGIVNETYYAFTKAARLMGSNHVDLCSRLCHAASVSGLKDTLGVAAPTCSLSDMIGSDLVVIWGSHLANNQPVTTKYLTYAKRKGTRILVVNPMREPGLERYWVPSDVRSALFGTKLMDDFFQVGVGGDIAFIHGVLKHLFENDWIDRDYVMRHTEGIDALRQHVEGLAWERLERESGQTRADMHRFAETYSRAKSCVFVYSMGLTQHRFGVDNVKSIVNLALARGMLGREKCGIMPIRGHSGVQGGGECGVDPEKYPGGYEVANASDRERFETLWGEPLPAWKGMRTLQMLEAAHRGELDFLYSLGGNLLETLPDREFMRAALTRVKLRVHQDIVLNTSSLLPGAAVLLLPAQTRYETPGGGTATSTERRIRFSPEIPGPRIEEAWPEWQIPVAVALAARPRLEPRFPWTSTRDIRHEIARAMPIYAGIENLDHEGQWVQWGGPFLFGDGFQKMPNARARFTAVLLPEIAIPDGQFYMTTRRGKQFNSMVHSKTDGLMGAASRDDVLMAPEDAARIGVKEGQAIRLRNETGEWIGVTRLAPMKPNHVQTYWPETNGLISRRFDAVSGEPDYNAFVWIETLLAPVATV
ncbi:MAG: FdhF/YdeP family oxidoreductase [Candidatus Eisenbacteria bacterium]|uniref:FdhF/YdeP family oxidoreductase n=1 Tax=Eiseniibacteriota bacterium TaxID=2212470 RepID=A0A849SIV3_UNCEI|nr:FdhF/YdeP family oxidoreductase [Candidatus Eisenbacteria bacterium]